jgi:hypothetical protein
MIRRLIPLVMKHGVIGQALLTMSIAQTGNAAEGHFWCARGALHVYKHGHGGRLLAVQNPNKNVGGQEPCWGVGREMSMGGAGAVTVLVSHTHTHTHTRTRTHSLSLSHTHTHTHRVRVGERERERERERFRSLVRQLFPPNAAA